MLQYLNHRMKLSFCFVTLTSNSKSQPMTSRFEPRPCHKLFTIRSEALLDKFPHCVATAEREKMPGIPKMACNQGFSPHSSQPRDINTTVSTWPEFR